MLRMEQSRKILRDRYEEFLNDVLPALLVSTVAGNDGTRKGE
jgi:hypothetical protein